MQFLFAVLYNQQIQVKNCILTFSAIECYFIAVIHSFVWYNQLAQAGEIKVIRMSHWISSKDQQSGLWELQCGGEEGCSSLCQVCHHVLLTHIEVRFLTHHSLM